MDEIETTYALTWGVPVDASFAMGHVEAYVEHSITTDAFREFVHRGRDRGAATENCTNSRMRIKGRGVILNICNHETLPKSQPRLP